MWIGLIIVVDSGRESLALLGFYFKYCILLGAFCLFLDLQLNQIKKFQKWQQLSNKLDSTGFILDKYNVGFKQD